jgi:hypothetical protein
VDPASQERPRIRLLCRGHQQFDRMPGFIDGISYAGKNAALGEDDARYVPF